MPAHIRQLGYPQPLRRHQAVCKIKQTASTAKQQNSKTVYFVASGRQYFSGNCSAQYEIKHKKHYPKHPICIFIFFHCNIFTTKKPDFMRKE
ncbi:hypothetical protein D0T90_02065 [Neisseria animalis]|uniref:Uncharacterized protein n=1 Tax=Neisseria animalis TaxID=492 RepID=A0A5P3MRL6_NEIAN|nr:hypothetical protein D0T90_02065 [Neisseria animalis]ROW33277.1 hypothetical protein CGZ60_00810 [Neisseria animalis]